MRIVRVGTRGSRLALAQAAQVIDALSRCNRGVEFKAVVIRTLGDRNRSASVSSLGVGVYVKEIEDALERGEIDVATHSLKDLTSEMTPGFLLAAVLERGDPRDALVSRSGAGLAGLPRGAVIGTGSVRRRALLKHARPDVVVRPVRGNVDTRLAMINRDDGPDAVSLAAAGLSRIGLDDAISEYADPGSFIPAVGQGAIAIETIDGREDALAMAQKADHAETRAAVTAERAFLAAMRGGCSAPTSAYAKVEHSELKINAFASDPDGKRMLRATEEGVVEDATKVGIAAARALLRAGAAEILGRSPASPGHDDE